VHYFDTADLKIRQKTGVPPDFYRARIACLATNAGPGLRGETREAVKATTALAIAPRFATMSCCFRDRAP
jgi:hypothetical protein